MLRAYVQYNAIMLVRILSDNPGKSFTRNIDGKFVSTIRELLRDGRDMSVQQILRETLDSFEQLKQNDETLTGLIAMWKKEKSTMAKRGAMVRVAPTHASWIEQAANVLTAPSGLRPRKHCSCPSASQLRPATATTAKLLLTPPPTTKCSSPAC